MSSAIPQTDSHCADCNRLLMQLLWSRGDLRRAKYRLRGARADAAMAEQVKALVAETNEKEANLLDHLDRVHPDGIEPRTTSRIARLGKPKPEAEIPEGHAKCSACAFVGKVLPSGLLNRHHSTRRDGHCPSKVPAGVKLEVVAPPVVIPERMHPVSAGGTSAPPKRPDSEPSRLDVGSHCRECGKWLPGERSLCGRCSVRKAS